MPLRTICRDLSTVRTTHQLIASGMTYERETEKERVRANAPGSTFTASIITDFFKSREEKREQDAVDRAWKRAGVVT